MSVIQEVPSTNVLAVSTPEETEPTEECLFCDKEGVLSKAKLLDDEVHIQEMPEPEAFGFYHMDLYESRERLAMFIEEKPAFSETIDVIPEESLGFSQEMDSEQKAGDIQSQEVDELARQYGLLDDKEIEMEEMASTLSTHPILEQKDHYVPQQNIPSEDTSYSLQPPKAAINGNDPLHSDGFVDVHDNYNTNANSHLFEHITYENHRDTEPFQFGEQDYEVEVEEEEIFFLEPSGEMYNAVNYENLEVCDKELEQYEQVHLNVATLENEALDLGQETEAPEIEEVPDVFCAACKTPIRAFEKLFGTHKGHDVIQITEAVEYAKGEIHANVCKVEEQIVQMENFSSHTDEIFLTVEENFGRQEQNLEQHYNEVMDTITQQYEEKTQSLEQEKKYKLETLYEQLVSCGEHLEISKDIMETIVRLNKENDKICFLKEAASTVDRLREFYCTDIDSEVPASTEFKSGLIDFTAVKQLMESINTIPAPSAPVINPQLPNSATSTSVRVCWSLFSDDTVECYQLYYKSVMEDVTCEEQNESMVKVKETYCTVGDLLPNTQYEFWVKALNTTGTSPPSERALYVTVPSAPRIKTKEWSSCPSAALIRWDSGNTNPVESYTVELCKINEEDENAVTESITGIPTCEALIPLEQGQQYLIYVRAVNVGGPSELSDPISIYTTGTIFHLNEDTTHPLLSVLEDGATLVYAEAQSHDNLPFNDNSFTACVAAMGNLIQVKGQHYWEIEVDENTEYRIGVAYEDTQRNGYLGGNNTSWCMRHIITPTRHKYEFLHNGATPDVRITIPPKRVGILLDYDKRKLSFFNNDLSQHLYSFTCHFKHFVHPCFALDKPGYLIIINGIAVPNFVQVF
ncbi:fibronectin type III and SPRY domain-containing protein 2 [Protopterus annectens]|uniref:fibronectin type III and SPRY domain-containing protein 2 n=1 Tax=Protopterus annectens TaxID=7888 RepID=UPI001CF9F6EB|nr:fibronectin type III and SPRY domain-containing protein 2 [Protopterus annectens]